jgi:hypothetical protein
MPPAPVASLVSTRRTPLPPVESRAALTRVGEVPVLAALILSRTEVSVSVAATSMRLPFSTKAPAYAAPSASVALACARPESFSALAVSSTSTW